MNIVAASGHVFHSSLLVSCSLCLHIFALASCLNHALLMHLSHRFLTHPCNSLLRILVLFMALALTLMVWAPAPEVPRMKSSMQFFQILHTSKRRSRKSLPSRLGCPVWIHILRKTLGDFATRLAEMEQNFSTFTARLCKVERCSLGIKCIWFGKILAFTRTSCEQNTLTRCEQHASHVTFSC